MSLRRWALGERSWLFELPQGACRRAALERIRAVAGVLDAWLTSEHLAAWVREGLSPEVLEAALAKLPAAEVEPRAARVIRVRYDGPDLSRVAERTGQCEAEVVALHQGRPYQVEFLGFLPGFAYLGPVDERIRAPRLETPRPRVPAGALALAEDRTAIYPQVTPGGWNLIGTAVDFEPFDRARGAVLQVGDWVRFEAA